MGSAKSLVCLIASGVTTTNLPLQPWRFLFETARQLRCCGYDVRIISNGEASDPVEKIHDVPVYRIQSINNAQGCPNQELYNLIEELQPSIVLWHMGLTSILHQRYALPTSVPIIGIFTSPIYGIGELLRLGLGKIIAGRRLSLTHLIGALIPNRSLRHFLHKNDNLLHIVVQTEILSRQIRDARIWSGPITVIQPGVDIAWCQLESDIIAATRDELAYQPTDRVVVYFGSPAPLRGLHTLIQAVKSTVLEDPAFRLLILSRRREDELLSADAQLRRLLRDHKLQQHIQIISGFLPQSELVRYVNAADVVALPFELVPSDAPLSLLETEAITKPIITTNIACLPELVSAESLYLVQPGNAKSLSRALVQAIRERGRASSNKMERHTRRWTEVGSDWSRLLISVAGNLKKELST